LHLLHFLSGGGSWALSLRERLVVTAAIRLFSPHIQETLYAQLRQRFFVERVNRHIPVLRYYARNEDLRVTDQSFSDLLVVVPLSVDDANEKAHVTFYEGFLFSLEFRHKPSFYAGRLLSVGEARLGRPRQTYTRAIDRLEHGRTDG
jgi:hypothetical protein